MQVPETDRVVGVGARDHRGRGDDPKCLQQRLEAPKILCLKGIEERAPPLRHGVVDTKIKKHRGGLQEEERRGPRGGAEILGEVAGE